MRVQALVTVSNIGTIFPRLKASAKFSLPDGIPRARASSSASFS